MRFGARDYDPETGRWLSKDPILFAGGDTNLYGYVMNEPVNFIDSDGLSANDVDRIRKIYEQYVSDLTRSGKRRSPGWPNVRSTSDNQDRMLTHGTLTFSHNQNGERTQKSDSSSSPAAVTDYTYDSVGSLIRVDLPSSDYVEYLYDAFDRRSVRKLNGTVDRYYVYQSDLQIAAEYDSSYALVARYVYASQSHVPDYVVKGGISYRIVTDHLGSVRLVVRADTGAIAQAISYDEFGRVLSDSSPGFQAFGFAGGLYDHQTSLVRFGARDYDPETGRWTSKDPILFEGGDTNLYGYVLNDPINLIDPEGKFPWIIAIGVAAGVFSATPTETPGAAQQEMFDVPMSVFGATGGGAVCKASGPAGPIFGRARYRNGVPGMLNQGDNLRVGWSWNAQRGRNMFGVHGGRPGTPGHWHVTPIPGPRGPGW